MLERARTTWSIALVLLVGCNPVPSEVADTGLGDGSAGTSGTTTGGPPSSTTEGSATVASADGTGSEGTTMTLDGGSGSSTTGEPVTTSGSSEGTASSSGDEGEEDDEDDRGSTTTTGEPEECHPILAEVLFDAQGVNDRKQWVRLYNPCAEQIALEAYTLAWGGNDYTHGRHELTGSLAAGDCWVVGGPDASNENANPVWDQDEDFSPDLQLAGGTADAVALFLGEPDDVMADTVPLDAVIYGDANDNDLLDAEGNTPEPHVGNVAMRESIRRTGLDPVWEVANPPTPNECPVL